MEYSEDLEVQDRRYGSHDERHHPDSSTDSYQGDYSKDDPFVLESTVIIENVKDRISAKKLWKKLGIDNKCSVIEKNLLFGVRGPGLIAIVRFRNNMVARKFALFDCIGNIREMEIAYSKGRRRFPCEIIVEIVNVDLNITVKELVERFSSFGTASCLQLFVEYGCPQDFVNIKFLCISEAFATEFAINGKRFESDKRQMFAHVALDFVEGCRELVRGSFNEDTERAEIILPDNINVGFVNIPDCPICRKS